MPEALPPDLEAALARSASRRGVFGRPAIFFHETESTNDVALDLAERGAPEGTMVLAGAQTAGRGRLGRVWFSPPGAGLYVSIVCRNARGGPRLTLAGGVAVADGVRQATGLPVWLKWPNDVVVIEPGAPRRQRKVAGILAEASSGREGLQYVVLGFGINLRNAAYPPELAERATSLEMELGRMVDDGAVLAEVLCAFNARMVALAHGDAASVLERWRELAPTAAGARVEWTADGATRAGVTGGIDDSGALLVRTRAGTERIVAGEVRWL